MSFKLRAVIVGDEVRSLERPDEAVATSKMEKAPGGYAGAFHSLDSAGLCAGTG